MFFICTTASRCLRCFTMPVLSSSSCCSRCLPQLRGLPQIGGRMLLGGRLNRRSLPPSMLVTGERMSWAQRMRQAQSARAAPSLNSRPSLQRVRSYDTSTRHAGRRNECGSRRAPMNPYVEVVSITAMTTCGVVDLAQARLACGATCRLASRPRFFCSRGRST